MHTERERLWEHPWDILVTSDSPKSHGLSALPRDAVLGVSYAFAHSPAFTLMVCILECWTEGLVSVKSKILTSPHTSISSSYG